MANRFDKVQECDATKAHSSNRAEKSKNKFYEFN